MTTEYSLPQMCRGANDPKLETSTETLFPIFQSPKNGVVGRLSPIVLVNQNQTQMSLPGSLLLFRGANHSLIECSTPTEKQPFQLGGNLNALPGKGKHPNLRFDRILVHPRTSVRPDNRMSANQKTSLPLRPTRDDPRAGSLALSPPQVPGERQSDQQGGGGGTNE